MKRKILLTLLSLVIAVSAFCGIHAFASDASGIALYNCSSLTSIIIPDSVISINQYAFAYCTSLTTINYLGTEEQWNNISKGSDWDLNTGNYTITYNYTEE